MALTFKCHECGESLRVADEVAGRRIKCPECGGVTILSDEKPPPPAPEVKKPAAPAIPTVAQLAEVASGDDKRYRESVLGQLDALGPPVVPVLLEPLKGSVAVPPRKHSTRYST